MPVYNEEKNILEIVNRIKNVKFPVQTELIMVEDGSKDGTREEMEKIKSSSEIEIRKFYHKKNSGKGSAIRTGLSKTNGDAIIIQDADLEYNPKEIPKLVQFMKSKNLKAVYGSRMLPKHHHYSYISYYLGNIFLNKLTNLIYKTSLTDMETCYKLISADIAKNLFLKANKFDMEPEITAKIILMGHDIQEVPISYSPRTKKEGKKIGWKDGIQAVWTLFYWKFKGFSAHK